jgi:hypothetical protein
VPALPSCATCKSPSGRSLHSIATSGKTPKIFQNPAGNTILVLLASSRIQINQNWGLILANKKTDLFDPKP